MKLVNFSEKYVDFCTEDVAVLNLKKRNLQRVRQEEKLPSHFVAKHKVMFCF